MDYLRLEEVIEALTYLGGEGEWTDIKAQVTTKRRGSWKPYRTQKSFDETMRQYVHRHCEGYSKFIGPVRFSKVRDGRFRLVTPPTGGARITPQPPAKNHSAPQTAITIKLDLAPELAALFPNAAAILHALKALATIIRQFPPKPDQGPTRKTD